MGSLSEKGKRRKKVASSKKIKGPRMEISGLISIFVK